MSRERIRCETFLRSGAQPPIDLHTNQTVTSFREHSFLLML
jgi:hypothetical protein